MVGPGDDGVYLDCGAEDGGESVVAGGDASPLLQEAEATFNYVAGLYSSQHRMPAGVRRVIPCSCGAASDHQVQR